MSSGYGDLAGGNITTPLRAYRCESWQSAKQDWEGGDEPLKGCFIDVSIVMDQVRGDAVED